MNMINEVSVLCDNSVVTHYAIECDCEETLIDIENRVIKLNKRKFLDDLLYVRSEFEKMNCFILINGSRKDFVISGMSNQMSGGAKGYLVQIGEPGRRENLVNILEYADKSLIGTIEEQESFYKDWMSSILAK